MPGNPDTLRYAVSLSFVGDLEEYRQLSIPRSEEADFCVQPAGVLADMHLDLKHSLAWLSMGKKAWIAFPPTEFNHQIWVDIHNSSTGYLFLVGDALKKMEGGLCCVQGEGDLIGMPVGWPHFVATIKPSILVGSWIVENGYGMICSLFVYMQVQRIRHGGKNEDDEMGWNEKEASHFQIGVGALLGDVESLIDAKTVFPRCNC